MPRTEKTRLFTFDATVHKNLSGLGKLRVATLVERSKTETFSYSEANAEIYADATNWRPDYWAKLQARKQVEETPQEDDLPGLATSLCAWRAEHGLDVDFNWFDFCDMYNQSLRHQHWPVGEDKQ